MTDRDDPGEGGDRLGDGGQVVVLRGASVGLPELRDLANDVRLGLQQLRHASVVRLLTLGGQHHEIPLGAANGPGGLLLQLEAGRKRDEFVRYDLSC